MLLMTLCVRMGGFEFFSNFFFFRFFYRNEPPEDTKQVADERGRFDQIPTKKILIFFSVL